MLKEIVTLIGIISNFFGTVVDYTTGNVKAPVIVDTPLGSIAGTELRSVPRSCLF